MSQRLAMVALGVVIAIGGGIAQPPAADPTLRYKWQAGQSLTYKIVQQTVVQETSLDEKTQKPVTSESHTNLTLTRNWVVKGLDSAGVATLEMRITAIRNEIRQADGNTVVRDSSVPDDAKEMAAYLNTPVVVVRVDAQGRLVEVKESKQGSAARLHAEMPFRLTLPDVGPTVGQVWDRTFALKIDPPQGAGESYDYAQKYTCKGVKDGLAVVGVETTLKAPPKSTGEQVPLVPMLWTGEVYFNIGAGKYHAARLAAKAELLNHLGEGSKFVYQSRYSEDAIAGGQ